MWASQQNNSLKFLMSHNNYFRYKHSNKKEVNSGADKRQMETYD